MSSTPANSLPSRSVRLTTAAVALVWLLALADWQWLRLLDEGYLAAFRGLLIAGGALVAGLWARAGRRQPPLVRAAVWSFCYFVLWQCAVYLFDALVWDEIRASVARIGLAGLFFIGLAWVVWGLEQTSQHYAALRRRARQAQEAAQASSTGSQALHAGLPGKVSIAGERRGDEDDDRGWNPLDLAAWYYGVRSPRFWQSLFGFGAYGLAFLLAVFLLGQIGGCQEVYEMPAGGGEQQQIAQTVKIQKVIKKKFVINPFSAIIFNPPPIDDVKLQLLEVTQHMYTIGYGQGQGAGMSGGTARGKVRFIRLEYGGGDWNQDFGVGADLNMLIQYGVRTGHAVHNQTESRTVSQLGNFVVGKSPPLVYLTGQKNVSLSKSEIKTLREYLLDHHGMLFIDNGGSAHFHNQIVALMRQVLPTVDPVKVPLDDVIHRIPYPMTSLPYVAPHGGHDALGWKVDGRWVAYYHPGDIGDAWSDGHSGVDARVYEACYRLGTNIIFYAHVEYNKWLDARKTQ